jgi:hypothetical protein
MIAEKAQRVRVPKWALDILRLIMGLQPGEYVITLHVYHDGRRLAKARPKAQAPASDLLQ